MNPVKWSQICRQNLWAAQMTATTESYTIPLLESSHDNIPSCSWPNHCSDVVKWSSRGAVPDILRIVTEQFSIMSLCFMTRKSGYRWQSLCKRRAVFVRTKVEMHILLCCIETDRLKLLRCPLVEYTHRASVCNSTDFSVGLPHVWSWTFSALFTTPLAEHSE